MDLYIELLPDGQPVLPENQRNVLQSTLRLAMPEEILKAKVEFGLLKKCKTHLVYDEIGYIYHSRYCGICKEFIGTI